MGSRVRSVLGPLLTVALSTVCVADVIHVPSQQPTIQEGITAADAGDTVLVALGTYVGPNNRNLDFAGVNVILMSEAGAEDTTIDCEGQDRGFHFQSGEDSTSVVRGFTITNASGDGDGGGMRVHQSSPTIIDCVFSGNATSEDGAGMYLRYSAARIAGCVFSDNEAGDDGGAVHLLEASGVVLMDCTFAGNNAVGHGDGVACYFCSPTFSGCTFSGNGRGRAGGGIWCAVSSPTLSGCAFWGNAGHAFRAHNGSSPQLTNVTFCGNDAGMYCDYDSNPVLMNVIIAFSTAGEALGCDGSSTPTTSHSVVFANAGGDSLDGSHHSNLFVDPLFCDIDSDDFTLCANSPCLSDPGHNPWEELVGAYEEGCPDCDSPAESATWSTIKATFRCP